MSKYIAEIENVNYAIDFLKKRKKMADDSIRHFMYGERQAVNIALLALQEKAERENPQPLTVEQLKERVGKPIWDNCNREWFILNIIWADEETGKVDWLEDTAEYNHGYSAEEQRFYKYKPKEL